MSLQIRQTTALFTALAFGGSLAGLAATPAAAGSSQSCAITSSSQSRAITSSSQSRSPAPAQATAGFTPIRARIDVDGDHRRDTISFVQQPSTHRLHRFLLTVTTAAGRTDTMRVAISNEGQALEARNVWAGTAHADGTRGAEMLLDLGGGIGDAAGFHMYTWRRDRIASAPAPVRVEPGAARNYWNVVGMPWGYSGYTFASTKGVRTVTWHQAMHRAGGGYDGHRITARWTNGGWKQVSKTRLRGLTEAQADRLGGWFGITWR